MSSAILSRRQIWLAQTSLPDTIRKELIYMPVTPGRVFHPDSQATLDKAEQARCRREPVQRTFGRSRITRQSYQGCQPPQPPHFNRPQPWEFGGRQNSNFRRFDDSRSARREPWRKQVTQSRSSVRDAAWMPGQLGGKNFRPLGTVYSKKWLQNSVPASTSPIFRSTHDCGKKTKSRHRFYQKKLRPF